MALTVLQDRLATEVPCGTVDPAELRDRVLPLLRRVPDMIRQRATEGESWAHVAAGSRGPPAVELLRLCPRALLNAPARDGQRPLHLAAFFCDAGLAGELLALGADPNARDSKGYSSLQVACEQFGRGEGVPETVRALVAGGADRHARRTVQRSSIDSPRLDVRHGPLEMMLASVEAAAAGEGAGDPGRLLRRKLRRGTELRRELVSALRALGAGNPERAIDRAVASRAAEALGL